MQQLAVALSPRCDGMKQRTAAVIGRPPDRLVQPVQILLELGRRVPCQVSDTETRADKVDDDTGLLDGDHLARQVADREDLG